MRVFKLCIAICMFMIPAIVGKAQQAVDSAQKKVAPAEVQTTETAKPEGKKAKEKKDDAVNNGETSVTGKKPKGKKKSKDDDQQAAKLDSTSTRADSINASLPKALRNAKSTKASTKKANSKKAPKAEEPLPEPKIIPGAEAKANAETKDKEDRTMKGPSGQKVYSSPKGGKYYFDVNGNKKFLKRDNQK